MPHTHWQVERLLERLPLAIREAHGQGVAQSPADGEFDGLGVQGGRNREGRLNVGAAASEVEAQAAAIVPFTCGITRTLEAARGAGELRPVAELPAISQGSLEVLEYHAALEHEN